MATPQTTAKKKYNNKSYDRIYITVRKGNKALAKAHAKQKGVALNRLLNSLIDKELADG